MDRSYVTLNRASTERIRALAARLSDAEMQTAYNARGPGPFTGRI